MLRIARLSQRERVTVRLVSRDRSPRGVSLHCASRTRSADMPTPHSVPATLSRWERRTRSASEGNSLTSLSFSTELL
jgi:hypothetical protein